MSSQFTYWKQLISHFKSQTPDVVHVVTPFILFFHTHEPLDCASKGQRHVCERVIVLLLFKAPL